VIKFHLTHVGSAMQRQIPRHCEPTGRRKAPPDDRLREAIQKPTEKNWIASSLALLAMTETSSYSPSDISAALPPAAAVLTVTVCSVAKRVK
jgi:hypothetical protein